MPDDVSRTEFDGLGGRVNTLERDFAGYKGEHGAMIKSINTSISKLETNTIELSKGQQKLAVAQAGLSNRLIGIGIVIVVLSPLVTAFIVKWIIPAAETAAPATGIAP
jgi:hypothetical protein